MIRPSFFVQTLRNGGVSFYSGVPDSLLKSLCAYITDHADTNSHIIAANEGAAIGLATGYHLATGKTPIVYMQNSGLGNAINPLLSLVDEEVYHIPLILLIGWRGEPGVRDEPQHIKQGKVTLELLETMGIKYTILSDKEEEAGIQLEEAFHYTSQQNTVYAIVVRKDTFDNYQLQQDKKEYLTLSREEAIQMVAQKAGEKALIVSSTGMISRELFEYREINGLSHAQDFLTVGSMGHASQIALGIALHQPEKIVWCFDGDGAVLMHLGSLSTVGVTGTKNLFHVVFNNGAHDSVGGQPTVAFDINIPRIAKAAGYRTTLSVEDKQQLEEALSTIDQQARPLLLEIKVKKGNRKDLGRPTIIPSDNKKNLMMFLKR